MNDSAQTERERKVVLLTVQEVAERLKLGKSTVYLLIQRGEIPVVRIGTSVRIPDTSLERWVSSKLEGNTLLDAG